MTIEKQLNESMSADEVDRAACCDECDWADKQAPVTVSNVVIVAETRSDFYYYSEVFGASHLLSNAAASLKCISGGASAYTRDCHCANCKLCGVITRASEYLVEQARASVPWASAPVVSNRRPIIGRGANADTVSRF